MIGSEPLLKIVCLAQVAQNPMLAAVKVDSSMNRFCPAWNLGQGLH